MMRWLHQCKFEIMRNLRNRRFLIFSLLMPIAFYFMFSHIYGNAKVGNTTFHIYYLISMASFSVVGGALNGLSTRFAHERTQGWLRLVQTTPLRASAYVSSKIVGQILINALMVLILFLAAGLFNGVHLSAYEWIMSFIWLTIGSLPFITLGMLIGLLAGIEAAQVISSLVYFVISILGGLWFPITLFSGWFKQLGESMPSYRLANVSWEIVAGQVPHASDFLIMAAYLIVFACASVIFLNRSREFNN